jgi:hypothetical protein
MKTVKFFTSSGTKRLLSLVILSLAVSAGADQPVLSPVRYAHERVIVSKVSFVKNSAGVFDRKTEKVCIRETQAPVYDLRLHPDLQPSEWNDVTCLGQLGQRDVHIKVSPRLFLKTIPDAITNEKSDVKVAGVLMSLTETGEALPPAAQPGSATAFATKDLGLSSMLLEVWPSYKETCAKGKSCTVDVPELFYAELEIKDNP